MPRPRLTRAVDRARVRIGYAIAVGNPAREVRRRVSDEDVEALRALRWWDWPEERIRVQVGRLSSGDVAALLTADEPVPSAR
jgi:hypothetical protein